jgi:putative mRNA 3-end processing factor
MPIRAHQWLKVTPKGLYCEPGDFYIDPHFPAERAVITHGHADHARPGHDQVLATPETLAIMKARYRDYGGRTPQPLKYGETVRVGGVDVRFAPAGHVLGSAQAVLEYGGERVIVTGDYKRRLDPTCPPYEVIPCDVLITEATFGLPVFHHPPTSEEIRKLLDSLAHFPDQAHLVGVYALGKFQRVLMELRRAGYHEEVYLHGAMESLAVLYTELGVDLGRWKVIKLKEFTRDDYAGKIVFCPPSALAEKWSRRFGEPMIAMASGWMRVRARARQKHVELPLIISDHCDWDELCQTIREVKPQAVWVTHGREDALVHWARAQGYEAEALHLVGREEEEYE